MNRTAWNTAELELLYRQHGAALFLFALSRTRERSSAEDAVQQVFLKLIEDGGLKRAIDKKAYLFGCVRNAIVNETKFQRRNTPIDPDSKWFIVQNRQDEEEQNLRSALDSLPEEQKEIIVLHVWGDLTFGQIGEILGISSNTAASRYRYGIAKLRELVLRQEKSCVTSR